MRSFSIGSVILTICLCFTIKPITGIVHLNSLSTSFLDSPARFGSSINGSGICGALYVADPLDACSSLLNNGFHFHDPATLKFALIVRGNCTFEDKIRNAQKGGFNAAIVFDDRPHRSLISMIGSPKGIWIPGVFISNVAGEALKKHAQGEEGECCIFSYQGQRSWNVLIISLISLLVIVAVLTTFFFARIFRRNQQRSSNQVGGKLVESLPCLTFSTAHISGYMGETCAICLDCYKEGDNLKVLPCQHKFHADCVGSWLTKWNTFCPICKYDLKIELAQLEVSERRRGLFSSAQ